MKHLILIIFAFLTPRAEALAPDVAQIVTLSVTAKGTKKSGVVYVEAAVDDDLKLELSVSSDYGTYTIENGPKNPRLYSLTISKYHHFDDPDLSFNNDLFWVCMHIGDDKRISIGTKQEPDYLISNQYVAYEFSPTGYREIFINDKTAFTPTNCDPYINM